MRVGFILTRHVQTPQHNSLWMECCKRIRLFYPKHPIWIVDDHSHPEHVLPPDPKDQHLYIIPSDFPKGRGELLPYYYLLHPPPYVPKIDKAVILHDGVFLSRSITAEIDKTVEMRFLWHFAHIFDLPQHGEDILMKLNMPDDFMHFYRERPYRWWGCFGVQSIVTRVFLEEIDRKYNFLLPLTQIIVDRERRMDLERVMAGICTYECKELQQVETCSLWGCIIYNYPDMKMTWNQYAENRELYQARYPMVKVWNDR